MNKKPIVVTTEFRGVFFGYVNPSLDYSPDKIELEDARMCVYWSSSIKGVLGLAATGPNEKCRIGPKVPKLTAWKITAVLDCTSEAAEQWEKDLWG